MMLLFKLSKFICVIEIVLVHRKRNGEMYVWHFVFCRGTDNQNVLTYMMRKLRTTR